MSVPGAHGSRTRALDPLELGLLILGMEPRASARFFKKKKCICTHTHTGVESLPTFPIIVLVTTKLGSPISLSLLGHSLAVRKREDKMRFGTSCGDGSL